MAAKVRSVGVGESERSEVEGFGDDLSEMFEKGVPRLYIDVRGPDGGGAEGKGLSLTRPLSGDSEREPES